MRVVQSVKHAKKGGGSKVLREGWMVHFTNRDHTVSVNPLVHEATINRPTAPGKPMDSETR